jgi:hypothetical protein
MAQHAHPTGHAQASGAWPPSCAGSAVRNHPDRTHETGSGPPRPGQGRLLRRPARTRRHLLGRSRTHHTEDALAARFSRRGAMVTCRGRFGGWPVGPHRPAAPKVRIMSSGSEDRFVALTMVPSLTSSGAGSQTPPRAFDSSSTSGGTLLSVPGGRAVRPVQDGSARSAAALGGGLRCSGRLRFSRRAGHRRGAREGAHPPAPSSHARGRIGQADARPVAGGASRPQETPARTGRAHRISTARACGACPRPRSRLRREARQR